MESLPPPSSPLASPPMPRSSLPENPISLFQQPLPLPSPPPRRRPRRKPVAAAEVTEARSLMASAQRPRRGKRGASSTASRSSRGKIRKPEEEIVGEGTTDVTRGNDEDDDVGRAKKRKRGKEKVASAETSISVPLVPNSSRSDAYISHVDPFVGENASFERFLELIMWKNVAKSTLWFGSGSAFFLSSCCSKDSRFSTLSALSHIGLFVASAAFVKNTISQRQKCTSRAYFQLTEDDILCVARFVLPVVNTSLTKAQDIFSGDPSWTLKIVPVLLLGANYGHLITFWRLLATGFFATFTLPKLYCLYTQQIHQTAENAAHWVLEAWNSCRRKKFIAASAAAILWNLFSAKSRFFAAFIFIVMLRYRGQQVRQEESGNEGKELEQQQGMVVAGETPPMMQLD